MGWFAGFSSMSGRRENRLKLSVLNTVACLSEIGEGCRRIVGIGVVTSSLAAQRRLGFSRDFG